MTARTLLPLLALVVACKGDDDDTGADTVDDTAEASDDTSDSSDASGDTSDASGDASDASDDTSDASDDTSDASDDTSEPSSGRLDVLAWTGPSAGGPGFVNVSLSTGSALADSTNWRPNGIGPGSTANLIGDFDGDGKDDLLAWTGPSAGGPGSVGVSLSTGSAFADSTNWRPNGLGPGATANLVGDFDGDGRDDLLAWTGAGPGGPGYVNVSLSTGSAFADSTNWRPNGIGPGATANLIGDFDGDGKDDVLAWSAPGVTGPGPGYVGVSLSTGSAFADSTNWRPNGLGAGATANLIGDFDGDGKDDLLTWSAPNATGPGPGYVGVSLSTGSAFADSTNWRPNGIGPGTTANFVGDFDGDGKDDLLTWSAPGPGGPGGASVHLSTGSSFADSTNWRTNGLGAGATANLVGDFDGE